MASYEIVQVAEITNTPNTIGMAESPLYGMSQADIDATLDQLQSIGVQNIRVFVPWGLIEQTDNTYDWSFIDRVMSAAAARNMGVMAEVNATPSWAAVPGSPNFPPGSAEPNVTKFTDFLNAFMAHQVAVPGSVLPVSYASIVSAYEVWNEPNYLLFSNPISPEAYATLLKAAYLAINNVITGDPTATVVAGAVGATQDSFLTMDPVEFVQQMLTALGPDALNYFDALSIHPYGTDTYSAPCPTCAPGILTPQEQVEAIMAMIGTKKVWLSEYGVSSTDAASAATQATWIKDLLDTWQNYDQAGPVFLYTARDTAGSTDPGATMGVWTSVGGEKVYVDGNGVSHTVSEMLADWIAAHPMPTNPTNPGIPILNPIAALVQAFVAGVQALVTAVVTAITNFLGGLAGVLSAPAAAAAPLALRSASVVSAETEGLAAESDATTADGKAADVTEKAATEETATEKTATEETAAEETATAETPAEATETAALPAVAATETAATATATVPVKVTEPTEPVKTEPVKTEATATTGTTTETSSSGTSTGSTTSGSSTEGSKSDESGKSSDASKSGESTKSGSTKSGTSEGQSKSGKDGDEGSGRHTRGKDGSGSGEVKAKPVTAGVGAEGAEGGEGSSDSAGGGAS
jgi:hypothetical protein